MDPVENCPSEWLDVPLKHTWNLWLEISKSVSSAVQHDSNSDIFIKTLIWQKVSYAASGSIKIFTGLQLWLKAILYVLLWKSVQGYSMAGRSKLLGGWIDCSLQVGFWFITSHSESLRLQDKLEMNIKHGRLLSPLLLHWTNILASHYDFGLETVHGWGVPLANAPSH